MSIAVAAGRGAEAGVLVRDAAALEMLAKVDTLAFDKTGTLTVGRPALGDIVTNGISEPELLQLAASVERASEHPLAEAIVRGAQERGAMPQPVTDFESRPGQGVAGRVAGKRIAAGTAPWLLQLGIDVGPLANQAEALRAPDTVAYVGVDGAAAGLLA